MPYNGSGAYSTTNPPPFVFNTIVSESQMNAALADIAAALSLVLVRDGQAAMIGNLNMGSQLITAIGNGTAGSPAVRFNAGGGFYSSGANEVSCATGGVRRWVTTSTVPMSIPWAQNTNSLCLTVSNTDPGNAASAEITTVSDQWATGLAAFSNAHSSLPGAGEVYANGPGGLVLNAAYGAGSVRFFTAGVEKHRVDQAGRWLNTANTQPAFNAHRGASQTSGTTILFDTELFDQGGNYTPGTGIFTAPVAGLYHITGRVTFFNNTGSNVVNAIYLNTDVLTLSIDRRDVGNGTYGTFVVDVTVRLAASTPVSVAAAALSANLYAVSGREYTYFCAHLIG